MTTRRPGPAALAAAGAVLGVVVGFAAGVGVARLGEDGPTRVAEAVPLPAVSPSYPVDPPPVVRDDPDTEALAVDLPSHAEVIGTPPFQLRLPVPDGWRRSASLTGEWKWFPPGQPTDNAFFLRVRLFSGYSPLESTVRNRIEALEEAGDVEDLVVEGRDDDGFVASYVTGEHRRVDMERYLSFDGGRTAFAVVAVLGRERDRLGMADLLERIARGAERL